MELSVVIALLAVITTTVVSFTLLTSRRVSEMSAKKAFYDELFYVKNMCIDPWLNEFDNKDTMIKAEDSDYQFEEDKKGSDCIASYLLSGKLYKENEKNQYKLMFDGKQESPTYGMITAEFPDRTERAYQCKYITGMKVDATLSYKDDFGECNRVITFSFNYKLSSNKNVTETIVLVKTLRTKVISSS